MATVRAMLHGERVSERARRRIREEMDARGISQRALADILSRRSNEVWSQPRLGKLLTGRVHLRLDEAALIADCIGLSAAEVIRDRGLEFYAEMTPTEVRILERIRQRPHIMGALMVLLDIKNMEPAKPPQVVDGRRRVGRPKNSERDHTEDHLPVK